jgi:toxin ParE1/3/4
MKVVFAEQARQDLASIYDHLSLRSRRTAQRVETMIRAQCERLAEHPKTGAMTDTKSVRRLPLVKYPYTIFYRVDAPAERIEIARVVHGARVRNLRRVPKE